MAQSMKLQTNSRKFTLGPSMKSPLAGTAWNFGKSQARQLCSAGLSVARLRQAAGDLKEMH